MKDERGLRPEDYGDIQNIFDRKNNRKRISDLVESANSDNIIPFKRNIERVYEKDRIKEERRTLKNEPSKKQGKFRGKNIKKRIAVILLALSILTGAGTATAHAIENSQETTKIVEQYDGNVEAMKEEIENIIASEFESTLGKENLSVDISRIQNGSTSIGNRIQVFDEEENRLINITNEHDLRGGPDYGNNKSGKLSSIADDYLNLEDTNPRMAARLLKKTEKTFEKRDLTVEYGPKQQVEKVDDVKSDGREYDER